MNILMENLPYIVPLLIAATCGFAIGLEREKKNKDVGIRTHGIVAIGSSLCMVISNYLVKDYPHIDPTRIAAQVVSGIGFLGAGLIIVKKERMISGLTTAAGIWTTAIIGISIGAGMYATGILSTILILLIQSTLFRLKGEEQYFDEQMILLTIHNQSFELNKFYELLKEHEVQILSFEAEKNDFEETNITFLVNFPNHSDKWEISHILAGFPGVLSIHV